MVNRYNNYRGMQRNSCSNCTNGTGARQNVERHSDMCECANDCKALQRRLQKIDFSIVDVVLYLDIYPECTEALALYNKLLAERETIRKTLSHKCKRPMSSFENGSETWDWISSPWPWEASAN